MNMQKGFEEMMEKISENMKNVKHKIAVLSGKGGVGKTTVAVNLAYALSKKNKVGLLDTDINGPNVPKMLGIEDEKLGGRENTITPVEVSGMKVVSIAFLLQDRDTPVIWRGPLKGNVINQFLSEVEWGNLDYLVVDLPPGTGDEALSIAQSIPDLDGVIIVTTPQDVAILDSRKAVNFARKVGVPVLGVIENMAGLRCPHCGGKINLFSSGGGEKAATEMGVPFLGRIPIQPEIVDSSDSGKPFILEHKDTEASKAFTKIVESITE
jgi:ATP-binding protein involved in chromosome partitioning